MIGIKRKRFGIKRKNKKRLKLRSKAPSISKLIKTADTLLSHSVRQIDPKEPKKRRFLHCYTCGYKSLNRKLHAGHFLSRYYKAARWHKDNVRPQCYVCNIMRKGDAIRFRQNLIKEIGEARVLAVEKLRDAPTKLTREFLTNLIQELSAPPLKEIQ